jgi:hypothetical protein
VYNSHSGKCERSSSGLDDKELYSQGRDLALAGPIERAIDGLSPNKIGDYKCHDFNSTT